MRIAIGVIRLTAIILLGLSLALPAIKTSYFNTIPDPWQRGYVIFLFGWLGVFGGQIEWFGNPALILVLLFPHGKFGRWVLAPLLALCILLAVTTLKSIPDEPGDADAIIAFGPGYYLWLAALTIGAVLPFVTLGMGSRRADAVVHSDADN